MNVYYNGVISYSYEKYQCYVMSILHTYSWYDVQSAASYSVRGYGYGV